jgi:TatA/E family protein of Tat protein translocase
MPFVSTGHIWLLLILLVIVLIVKGPGKLPEVGSALGRGLREFKKASSETHDAVSNIVHIEPTATTPAEPTTAAPTATPEHTAVG